MPKNGLNFNKILIEILSLKSVNVSRGKALNLLKDTLKNQKLKILKLCLENKNDFVKEHCIELRNKVQLATEEAMQQMNQFNEQLIDQIDEYEKELVGLNTKQYLESIKIF